MKKPKFEVGEQVRVYSLIKPRRDLKGTYKITHIGKMNSSSEEFVWLEGLRGAYCLEAIEKIND